MADEKIDTSGLTCPRPLVETKKKLKKMKSGETLEVIGDHAPSKKEIPEMMGEQGHKTLKVTQKGSKWHVVIKKGE